MLLSVDLQSLQVSDLICINRIDCLIYQSLFWDVFKWSRGTHENEMCITLLRYVYVLIAIVHFKSKRNIGVTMFTQLFQLFNVFLKFKFRVLNN
jgi:hypothetical protein